MNLSLIVAAAENGVIGKDNDLIWRLPNDLKYFKRVTSGHCIIMGRKNYESIGRPLPKRTNIIITRNPDYQVEGCRVVNSLEAALEIAKEINDDEPFIIGGGEIYRMSLPLVDTVYYTAIHQEFEGDTYFEDLNDEWNLISEEAQELDEKNTIPHTFKVYKRK